MSLEFLKTFKPDGDALLRRISPHIDDAMLELITNEDPVGGDARLAKFINALRDIRAGGDLKKQSDFASWDEFRDQDVTEMLRWSSPAEPDTDENIDTWRGTRGHWTRAFACAVLLRSYADREIRLTAIGNYNNAIIQLIESVRRLDAGLEPETMAALAWFIMRAAGDPFVDEVEPDQTAFAGVGILWLAINPKNMVSQETIMALTDWLMAEEKRAFEERGGSVGDFPTHWLFRTTFFDGDREKWMAIGSELSAYQVAGPCGDAVRDVGLRLSGQTS